MSEKSEKPIIFSGPMVRAILEGRKTQTRRAVKPQPGRRLREAGGGLWVEPCESPFPDEKGDSSWGYPRICPYETGMTLWVRETFCAYVSWHVTDGRKYAYKADANLLSEEARRELVEYGWPYRWRPPLHMPRQASRITLRVTGVRCQRVRDITEDDAVSEGMPSYDGWMTREHRELAWKASVEKTKPPRDFPPRRRFAHMWDSLNKKRGLGWDDDPWVWAVGFEVLAAAE